MTAPSENVVKLFIADDCPACDDVKSMTGDLAKRIDVVSGTPIFTGRPSVQKIDVMTREGEEQVNRYGLDEVPTAVIEAGGRTQKCSVIIEDGRIQLSCGRPKNGA